MPSRPLPASPGRSSPHSTRIRVRVLFLALIISFSSLFLLAFLFFLLYLYFSLLDRSPTLPFDSAAPLRLHRFSYRELRSATNGFDSSHSLGRGGSGSVFRGVLRDGKSVAVKRLDPGSSSPSDREFQNELQILGGLSSPYVVLLLGYCVEKKKRLLVYEYMCNRSLQEALFGGGAGSGAPDLDWDQRFKIVLDIAQAISFLHLECDPPVIHGDIKPSNVLLGADFRAKLSDFGLSRIKNEGGDLGIEFFSQDLGRSQELWKSQELASGHPHQIPPVDFSLAIRAPSSSKKSPNCNSANGEDLKGNSSCLKGKDAMVPEACNDDLCSIDFSKELNGNTSSPIDDSRTDTHQWVNDWWWRQDGSGELSSKDYVREWIGSQICPSTNPDWDDDKKSSPRKSDFESTNQVAESESKDETPFDVPLGKSEKKEEKGLNGCEKKRKKMKEWWKEEYFAEISEKSKNNKGFKWFQTNCNQENEETSGNNKNNYNKDWKLNMDISFRKGWKKKRSRSVGSEMWSGDLFSRELSSTTSMRGTVCYVAPEYGGCGYLMEKADIYSFGVLILVIVSGRRPLHVLSSPMKLEKANLISWCRHLAQTGNILELVDERLKDLYDKDQATLCINLALLCLQRMPELRPDGGDIVKILKGEMDPPALPVEFSPSPPSKLYSRSRRKPTSQAE